MRTVKAAGHDVPLDALIMALHNGSRPVGMGFLSARGPLTRTEARVIAQDARDGLVLDYLFGRPIKVSEHNGEIDGRLYDRDNGVGAFEAAVLDALTTPEAA